MKNNNYKIEYDAHQKFISGVKLSLYEFIYMSIKIPFNVIEGLVKKYTRTIRI